MNDIFIILHQHTIVPAKHPNIQHLINEISIMFSAIIKYVGSSTEMVKFGVQK